MDNRRFDYSPIVKRPILKWPDNARLAIWIIINIEHFRLDKPATSLMPFPGVVPDIFNYAWRDYGPRVGIWRIMEVLDRLGIRASVALNSDVCIHNPIIVDEGIKRKWEILGHGVTNSQLLNHLSEEEERATIRESMHTIYSVSGERPQGWLGPALAETERTLDILAEEGFKYVCDWCNDDQPYSMKVEKGRLLSVPYSIEINDIPTFLGFGCTPSVFQQMICDQFDVLYEEGSQSGRVMALGLHPFLIGQPFRIKYLEKALQYMKEHQNVWFTTGAEIAKYFTENHLKSVY